MISLPFLYIRHRCSIPEFPGIQMLLACGDLDTLVLDNLQDQSINLKKEYNAYTNSLAIINSTLLTNEFSKQMFMQLIIARSKYPDNPPASTFYFDNIYCNHLAFYDCPQTVITGRKIFIDKITAHETNLSIPKNAKNKTGLDKPILMSDTKLPEKGKERRKYTEYFRKHKIGLVEELCENNSPERKFEIIRELHKTVYLLP